MNYRHTLSTFLFYRLLSLCILACFGLSCLFFFFPFGEPNDGVLVGHSVLRGSRKSLWRSPYLNSGPCRNKFFCSDGQDIDFKEKSGSTCIFTGNPPGHNLPSEFRFLLVFLVISVYRPSQLAGLSHSEFDPELFSHSAYVKFFCDIREKNAFFNILRQNETYFDIGNG